MQAKKALIMTTQVNKIAITGASGFLGSKLSAVFRAQGHSVLALGRSDFALDAVGLAGKMEGCSAIIHLAGTPVTGRWTRAYRQEIYDSRILTTRKLVKAIGLLDKAPECFICASAVGIYPEEGVHDENSKQVSDGFLGEVCRDWEAEALVAEPVCRTLLFRFGVILGRNGGALKKMALPFKLGLGGRIASGRQMMSWIHVDDVTGAVELAMNDSSLRGPVNVVAPNAVSNAEFTKALARALRRPAIFPVPAVALRLVYGDGAEVLTAGQTAVPGKLEAHNYRFNYPDADGALKHLFS